MGLCASKPAVWDGGEQQSDGFKPHVAAGASESGGISTSADKKQQQMVDEQLPAALVADAPQQDDSSNKTKPNQPCGVSASAMMILEVCRNSSRTRACHGWPVSFAHHSGIGPVASACLMLSSEDVR